MKVFSFHEICSAVEFLVIIKNLFSTATLPIYFATIQLESRNLYSLYHRRHRPFDREEEENQTRSRGEEKKNLGAPRGQDTSKGYLQEDGL